MAQNVSSHFITKSVRMKKETLETTILGLHFWKLKSNEL